MKNLGALVAALTLSFALAACGNNGDPGKKYSAVNAKTSVKVDPNAKPVTPAVTQPTPPPPPAQFDCNNPMKITVEKDAGNKLLIFNEDVEASYTVKIRSNLGADFKVETAKNNPDLATDLNSGRAKFENVSQEGNVAVFSFTWKPGKFRNGQKQILPLNLSYKSSANAICGSEITDSLNLVVQAHKAGDSK